MQHNKHHFSKERYEKDHHKHSHKGKKPGWFSEMTGRRSPRIERGDMRYLILDTLVEKGRHGYDIMQTIKANTDGSYLPSSGAIYPALQMLEDIGLLVSSEKGGKNVYDLTEKGREELEDNRSLLEDIYEDMGQGQSIEQNEFFVEIHDQSMNMYKTIARSFQRGRLDPARTDKIREIIHDAFKRVDEILKED